MPGWLTAEDNGSGIFMDAGRLETFGSVTTPAPNGGPIVIRDNTFAGITAMNGAFVQLARENLIRNNGTNGAILESIAGNSVPVNGTAAVVCDATAIVFGDLAGVGRSSVRRRRRSRGVGWQLTVDSWQ